MITIKEYMNQINVKRWPNYSLPYPPFHVLKFYDISRIKASISKENIWLGTRDR